MTKQERQVESGLEISILPARAEKKLVHLYHLTEEVYRVLYDKYTYDLQFQSKTDYGLFGSKSRVDEALAEIKEKRKRQGYRRDKEHPSFLISDFEEIRFPIKEITISVSRILKENGKVYLQYKDPKGFSFSRKRIEINT